MLEDRRDGEEKLLIIFYIYTDRFAAIARKAGCLNPYMKAFQRFTKKTKDILLLQ